MSCGEQYLGGGSTGCPWCSMACQNCRPGRSFYSWRAPSRPSPLATPALKHGALERSAFNPLNSLMYGFVCSRRSSASLLNGPVALAFVLETGPQTSKQVSCGQPLLQCSTDRGTLPLHALLRPSDTSEPATPCQLLSKKHTSASCGPPGCP
jgi:hypothetical protein